jgi:hypothetical protein
MIQRGGMQMQPMYSMQSAAMPYQAYQPGYGQQPQQYLNQPIGGDQRQQPMHQSFPQQQSFQHQQQPTYQQQQPTYQQQQPTYQQQQLPYQQQHDQTPPMYSEDPHKQQPLQQW